MTLLAVSHLVLATDDVPLSPSGPPKEHPWSEKSFLLTDRG